MKRKAIFHLSFLSSWVPTNYTAQNYTLAPGSPIVEKLLRATLDAELEVQRNESWEELLHIVKHCPAYQMKQ